MKFRENEDTLEQYQDAIDAWDSYKPPYSRSDILSCVTAAKTILAYDGKPRRSKYEIESCLKLDFSKAGKVSIYTHFPKSLGVKGKKLGEYPELQLSVARSSANALATGAITNDTVHYAIALYEKDIRRKNKNDMLQDGSLETYLCRTQKLKMYFNERIIFSDYKVVDVENMLDELIDNETGCYANELFSELKRVWRYAAPKLADCKNVVSFVAIDYVSSRAKKGKPCELYTDLENIAELWINMALAPSGHQKNAMRFMILTGIRPMNIHNLKWEWLDSEDYPTKIIFPRKAMKYKKSRFVLPITEGMRKIILEQKKWRDEVYPACSGSYVFLQPRNSYEAFATRSLDKLIKDYSPVDCIKGDLEEANIKGSAGAFSTMCRKFAKSNIVGYLKKAGVDARGAADISKLVLHHKGYKEDEMAPFYDFSEELYGQDFYKIKEALELHEKVILDYVFDVKGKPRKETGKEKKAALTKVENEEKKTIRKLIKSRFGKVGYSSFNKSKIIGSDLTVEGLILTKEGRCIISNHLKSITALAA